MSNRVTEALFAVGAMAGLKMDLVMVLFMHMFCRYEDSRNYR